MKKHKHHDSKKEVRLTMTSSSSTNGLGQNSGPISIDLMVDIFSRLSAKSIARFHCVSKDWAAILSSPHFWEKFLMKSSARPHLLFISQTDGKWSLFSSPQSLISDHNSSTIVVDKHMHVPKDYSFRICSPVSGFLCTKDEWLLSGRKERMMICNPSTGRFTHLPKVITKRSLVITYIGYDPIEKQYKVLCMTIRQKPFIYEAEEHQVLTLGTRHLEWRRVECSVSHYPQDSYPQNNEICIKGVIYYIAKEKGSLETSMIVCFDVRSEKFDVIINEAINDLGFFSTLISYKGQLGVLHSKSCGFMDGTSTNFELWVRNDSVEHEWSKHLHILPPLWKNLVAETEVYIVGMMGTSEIVFSSCVLSNPFYIFNLNIEKNTIHRVEIKGIGPRKGQTIYTFVNHVENLNFIM